MKDAKNASQMIEIFENLEPIEPSEAWNQSIVRKLSDTKPITISQFSTMPYTATMLMFISLNTIFIFNKMKKETPDYRAANAQTSKRMITLKTISAELLINPTSTAQ